MGDNNIELLRTAEYEAIGMAIFEKLAEITPEGMVLDYQSLEGINHIGFLTVPGGKYLSRDVIGGFKAQVPFQLIYKFVATNNKQRLEAEKVLNKICADLEERENYPMLTDGRKVTEVVFNSTPYRVKSDQDGSIQYVRAGELKYEK